MGGVTQSPKEPKEEAQLSEKMAARKICVAEDETYHERPCLVAIEPVANYILLEKYAEDRQAETWNKAISEAVKENFSFAYLKELYVTSFYIAASNNRKKQTYNDVEEALDSLCKDKSYVQTGFGLSSSKTLDMQSFFEEGN